MELSSNRNVKKQVVGSDDGSGTKRGNFLVFAGNDRNPLAQRVNKSGVFKTDLILTEIFKNLRPRDLLNCSLVNRAWCQIARTILRNEAKIMASLRGICPCREYHELSKLVRTSNNIPFNGMVIRTQWKKPGSDNKYNSANGILGLVEGSEESECRPAEVNGSEGSVLERNIEHQTEGSPSKKTHKCLELPINFESSAFFQKVELRFLEIDWEQMIDCQIETMIKVFLTKNVSRLVELKVTSLPPKIRSLRLFLEIPEESTKKWLPNVKILDLPPDINVKAVGRSVRRELLEASPNLLRLLGVNRYPDLAFFLEQYLTLVMKEFDFYYVFRNDKLVIDYKNYSLLNLIRTKPKLEKFFITVEFNGTRFEDTIHMLLSFLGLMLECSKFSLTELLVSQYQLMLLMFIHIIQPMPKVQRFHLGISCLPNFQSDVTLLKHIQWIHYFPNLRFVKIFLTECGDNLLPYATVPLKQLGDVQACSTVTQLTLRRVP
ncbi:unnamed protein product [Allacma fusca]|uniref:F-box domain-containing protein n=1 Tax=Allacma fusca TaxID=39272 RepID=A0A8J2K431_9HEXA|nr:unnamed protein product [Allacma fusca]